MLDNYIDMSYYLKEVLKMITSENKKTGTFNYQPPKVVEALIENFLNAAILNPENKGHNYYFEQNFKKEVIGKMAAENFAINYPNETGYLEGYISTAYSDAIERYSLVVKDGKIIQIDESYSLDEKYDYRINPSEKLGEYKEINPVFKNSYDGNVTKFSDTIKELSSDSSPFKVNKQIARKMPKKFTLRETPHKDLCIENDTNIFSIEEVQVDIEKDAYGEYLDGFKIQTKFNGYSFNKKTNSISPHNEIRNTVSTIPISMLEEVYSNMLDTSSSRKSLAEVETRTGFPRSPYELERELEKTQNQQKPSFIYSDNDILNNLNTLTNSKAKL